MFIQYCGLSDIKSAIVTGSMLVGAMIGGPVGGRLGDMMHAVSPYHGRPIMGQLSIGLRIPLLVAVFALIPKHPESFPQFAGCSLAFGLCCIAGVAVNRPIMSDVVKPQHRGTTFAMVIAVEGAIASLLGAPLVGILAEKCFGYVPTTDLVSQMPEELRLNNATALGKSLLLVTAVPWTISLFFYSGMHLTYGRDAQRLKDELRALGEHSCSSSEYGESAVVSRAASHANMRVLEEGLIVGDDDLHRD
eukprot:Selendium_serpulae@DN847_c0_g1_i1.p1